MSDQASAAAEEVSAIENSAEVLQTAPDTIAILQLFERMDATAPLMRLITAGSIVGVALLLLLVSRIVINRRVRKLEEMPEARFSPLRWQAQDIVTREDMKTFWLRLWRGLGWVLSTGFGLIALTGFLMTNSITLQPGRAS